MDALCIMTSILAGLCHQMKAPHSVQPEKHSGGPEVPTIPIMTDLTASDGTLFEPHLNGVNH